MHDVKEPDGRGLREFGLTMGAMVAILFGLLLPWVFGRALPVWPWCLSAVLVVWALAVPLSLGPLYRGWMRLGLLIGRITTPLVLGAIFFLIFMPVGLTVRLAGRDPMRRRLEAERPSYRMPSPGRPREHVERPF